MCDNEWIISLVSKVTHSVEYKRIVIILELDIYSILSSWISQHLYKCIEMQTGFLCGVWDLRLLKGFVDEKHDISLATPYWHCIMCHNVVILSLSLSLLPRSPNQTDISYIPRYLDIKSEHWACQDLFAFSIQEWSAVWCGLPLQHWSLWMQ